MDKVSKLIAKQTLKTFCKFSIQNKEMFLLHLNNKIYKLMTLGCGRPGPGGPGAHKVLGRNFTMDRHPQSFGRKSKRIWKFR